MAESLAYQLCDRGMVTDSLTMDVGYDRENCDNGSYRGTVHIDHYGRKVPKGAHGSIRLDTPTFLERPLADAACQLFDKIADPRLSVRRITINANRIVKDEGFYGNLKRPMKQIEVRDKVRNKIWIEVFTHELLFL